MTDGLRLDGHLTICHFRGPECLFVEASRQTITTLGKQWIVDKLQDLPAATQQLKWHQSGTGSTPATAADTGLQAGLYSRGAGTRTEGAGATIYRSVASVGYTGARTVAEWGIFTTSTAGVLMARKTFSRAVINGDTIQFTWDLTVG